MSSLYFKSVTYIALMSTAAGVALLQAAVGAATL
jgi:hypothetical protein